MIDLPIKSLNKFKITFEKRISTTKDASNIVCRLSQSPLSLLSCSSCPSMVLPFAENDQGKWAHEKDNILKFQFSKFLILIFVNLYIMFF